ncbi:MAG: hypothetical protein LQ344_004327 [Seirophora lacunosa]|nr:MAG: hypothetical protein LQ344_004327 [Seirophora lacunosa]
MSAILASVYVFAAADGTLLSTWRSSQDQAVIPEFGKSIAERSEDQDPSNRPSKRQKKASPDNASDSSSAEIVTEDGPSRPRKSKKTKITESNVVNLVATSDGQSIAVVTDEDKCVRVLRLDGKGRLQQLSQRQDFTFTPDEKTILCGDKYGDVYALPLHPAEHETGHVSQSGAEADEEHEAQPTGSFPSASTRTVHTLRNRQALKHQLDSANKKPPPKTLAFNHQLLLGHVSLLTDVKCIAVAGEESAHPPNRTYIITADRDEHIRISRGMPQAHIIEGFCLGHKHFVSKLCVPSWNTRLLISGGGDDHLLVWDWTAGHLLHRVNLQSLVMNHINYRYASSELLDPDPIDQKIVLASYKRIAVCGLYPAEARNAVGELRRYIAVAVEGYVMLMSEHNQPADKFYLSIPAVFLFSIADNGAMQQEAAIATEGNVISITVSKNRDHIAYAIDTEHKQFSQSQLVDMDRPTLSASIGILSYAAMTGHWGHNVELQQAIRLATRNLSSRASHVDQAFGGKMRSRDSASLLYGLENLRKRGQDE